MNNDNPKKNPKQLDRGDAVKITKGKAEDKILTGDKNVATKSVENQQKNRLSTVEGRKQLRDKYTIKINTNQSNCVDTAKCDFRNDQLSRKAEKSEDSDILKHKTKYHTKIPLPTQRKPVIQTFISKHDDHKTFKTVTFTDKTSLAPLQIKIPESQKISKASDTSSITKPTPYHVRQNETPAKASKEKTKKVRTQKKKRESPSSSSAPKEVVTWEPTSINEYTKPIYEAWVNKTPLALSGQDEELFLDAQTEETEDAVEFVFDPTDERFTGRIKVRR